MKEKAPQQAATRTHIYTYARTHALKQASNTRTITIKRSIVKTAQCLPRFYWYQIFTRGSNIVEKKKKKKIKQKQNKNKNNKKKKKKTKAKTQQTTTTTTTTTTTKRLARIEAKKHKQTKHTQKEIERKVGSYRKWGELNCCLLQATYNGCCTLQISL